MGEAFLVHCQCLTASNVDSLVFAERKEDKKCEGWRSLALVCHSKKLFLSDPNCLPLKWEQWLPAGRAMLEGHTRTFMMCWSTTVGKEGEHRATCEGKVSLIRGTCSLCHASSVYPKIQNAVGASKEPDSFLKWVRWHANPLIAWLRVALCFLTDRTKKQVEQVWMIPSYDMGDTGMCDGIIKQNCTSRAPPGVVSTMGWKEKKLIKGT